MVTINSEIDIDRHRVLRNIGYVTDSKLPVRMSSLVNDYVENACQLIEPSYSYVIRDIESVHESRIVIDGGITFESEVLARLMAKCEKVAVFALTIGKHLEEIVAQLAADGLILQAAVLDATGSVAAESVADFVEERVRQLADARGLCISQRFSPGHCDWNVDQQVMVFRAINIGTGEIRLTEKCLMLPRKSISGIIGIGPCSNIDDYNPCKTCEKNDNCPWRR